MKKICLLTLTLCLGVFAQSDTLVRWRGIEGVITAPGVDNPVGQIHSGAGPWTTKDGSARINLNSGEGSFEVEGLVLNGEPPAERRERVCNPGNVGGSTEAAIDTPATTLSTESRLVISTVTW